VADRRIVIDHADLGLPAQARPRPGHGRAILTMAIFGLMGCPVFSVVAWGWGKRELGRIRRGQADPAEEGRVRAAIILALVALFQLLVLGLPVVIGAVFLYRSLLSGDLQQILDQYGEWLRDLR
jgi:hypothetical protein